MDIDRLFDIDNGFLYFDGPASLGGSDYPNFSAPEGSIYFRITGEKFIFQNSVWIQLQSKQFELKHNQVYDDIIPDGYMAELYSPDLVGELTIDGEVLII